MWHETVNRPQATGCEILVASAKFFSRIGDQESAISDPDCFADFDYKVWEISYYCINTSEQKPTALLSRKLLSISRRNSQRGGSTIDTKPPPLLVSFRAHLKPVISLDFVDSRQFIISASTDASVRLWTQSGRYIGNMLKTNSGHELSPPPPPPR